MTKNKEQMQKVVRKPGSNKLCKPEETTGYS